MLDLRVGEGGVRGKRSEKTSSAADGSGKEVHLSLRVPASRYIVSS